MPLWPSDSECRIGLVSRAGPEPADRSLRAAERGRVMALVVIQSAEDVRLALELAALEPSEIGVVDE